MTDFTQRLATQAVAMVLIGAMGVASVSAQGSDNPKIGRRVRVTLVDGTTVRGTLAEAYGGNIVLVQVKNRADLTTLRQGTWNGERLTLARSDVASIKPQSNLHWKAAGIGAAIAFGLILIAELTQET